MLHQEVEAESAQPLGGIFGSLGSAIRQLTGHARRDLPAPGACLIEDLPADYCRLLLSKEKCLVLKLL